VKDFFDQTEILNVLHGFNPWWSGRPYTAPEFKRLAFETCSSYLQDSTLRRAILLSGPRRVGKTTILTQIANNLITKNNDPKSVFYISLDHPLIKLLNLRQILEIYHESVYSTGKQSFLLFDEIQYTTVSVIRYGQGNGSLYLFM
jgi:predicted AAA+ superfamily ATPase